jgi:hypothetical protein
MQVVVVNLRQAVRYPRGVIIGKQLTQILFTIKMMMQIITMVPTMPYPNISVLLARFSARRSTLECRVGQSTVSIELARAWPLGRSRSAIECSYIVDHIRIDCRHVTASHVTATG